MLLLHGGSNANRSGLLVLQHVSEALGGGREKKREEVKEGDRGYTEEEEEEAGFHINSFLMLRLWPQRLRWLFCWHSFSLSII